MSSGMGREEIFLCFTRLEHNIEDSPPYADWRDDLKALRDAALADTRPTSAGQSEEVVERVARIVDPSSWRVMDGYLEETRRKYRGQNVSWPSDQFQHKESMAKAREILSTLDLPTIQRDARREVELLSIISVLEVALKKIAGGHWERFGTEADVDEVPDLSADEAMRLARDALVQEFALKEGTGE